MANTAHNGGRSNGVKKKRAVSKLGRDLLRIKKKIKASGEKMLTTRRDLEREITSRRTGGF